MVEFVVDKKLILLGLILNATGAGHDTSDLADRVRLQKTIYLAQRVGFNLGYRFSWYKKGPYSTKLADDYYALANYTPEDFAGFRIKNTSDKLERIKTILSREETLNQADWCELLASYDYLRHVRNLDDDAAEKELELEKPHLVGYLEKAKQALLELEL